MKTRRAPYLNSHLSQGNLLRAGIFVIVAALLAIPLYRTSSASLSRRGGSGQTSRAQDQSSDARRSAARLPLSPLFNLAPVPTGPGIATFDGTCTNPQTSWQLGNVVCARVTGGTTPERRLTLVDPRGFIRETTAISSDPQDITFTLPSSETSDVGISGNPLIVDNRGTWKINMISRRATVVTSAAIVVSGPDAAADLSIDKLTIGGNETVNAGSSSTYILYVKNNGPNAAVNVVLTDVLPANTTFVAVAPSGGTDNFSCTAPAVGENGTVTCTLASLAPGSADSFDLAFTVVTGTPVGTVIANTATISSDTADPDSSNNSATAFITVVTAGAGTCTYDCPANIVVTADTTQDSVQGAFVSYPSGINIAGNCGAISASPASGSFFPVGTTTVNSSSELGGATCSFTVTVTTTPAPTISCPPDKTVTADSGGTYTFATAGDVGTPTFTPSTGTVTFARSDAQPSLTDPFPTGTTGITWTVSDSTGRTASCEQRIIVHAPCASDTQPPTVTAPPDISVGTGPASTTCGAVLDDELGLPEVHDDCSATLSTTGIPPGNLFPIGTTTITYTATDGSGHTATATQHVTVTDNTPPVIFAPANASYTCPNQVPALSASQAFGPDVNGNPDPTKPVFDNCGSPLVTASQTSSGAGSAASPLIIVRTYTALDSHGNTASAMQTITVTDPTPPVFTFVPADVTAYTGPGATSCDTVVNPGTATATDNCGVVNVTRSPAGNTFPVGATTITWTATDGAGNTTTANQTVTVIDNTPPVINCPASITLEPTCPSGAIGTYTAPVGTDNCPGTTTTRTAGQASGTVFPIGTSSVTYTANDAHGNSASCSFTVTVLTPQAVIQNLIAQVNASSLTGTQKNGLLAKLNAALDGINQGKIGVACNKLSDFVNNVGTLIGHGDLTAAQGNAWILSANHVQNTIGCTSNPCS